MDQTAGQLTTCKLQTLIDVRWIPAIQSRADVARALTKTHTKVSMHAVQAWFRTIDPNYLVKRSSLHPDFPSFPIPRRWWRPILRVFELSLTSLEMNDVQFKTWAFSGEPLPPNSIHPLTIDLSEAAKVEAYLSKLMIDEARIEIDQTIERALSEGHKGLLACALHQLVATLYVEGRVKEIFAVARKLKKLEALPPSWSNIEMRSFACMIAISGLVGRVSDCRRFYTEAINRVPDERLSVSAFDLISAFAGALCLNNRFEQAERMVSQYATNGSDTSHVSDPQVNLLLAMIRVRCGNVNQVLCNAIELNSGSIGEDFPVLSRRCFMVDHALRTCDTSMLTCAYDDLLNTYAKGIGFSIGWPYCVPHLVAKSAVLLGAEEDATYYFNRALDVCRRHSLIKEYENIVVSKGAEASGLSN